MPSFLEVFGVGRASRQAKRSDTAVINQFEPLFRRNLEDFRSGLISASEAWSNFDSLWSEMVSKLRRQASISERLRGGKFDWFRIFRDPINDEVKPSPQPVEKPQRTSDSPVSAHTGNPSTPVRFPAPSPRAELPTPIMPGGIPRNMLLIGGAAALVFTLVLIGMSR